MLTNLYVKALVLIQDLKNDERGVTAIEYGLIAVAMAALLVVAVGTTAADGSGSDGFIAQLSQAFDSIAASFDTVQGNGG